MWYAFHTPPPMMPKTMPSAISCDARICGSLYFAARLVRMPHDTLLSTPCPMLTSWGRG